LNPNNTNYKSVDFYLKRSQFVEYFYRPWKQPTKPDWFDGFVTAIKKVVTLMKNNPKASASKAYWELFENILDGKGLDSGDTFNKAIDFYRVGMYGKLLGSSLMDSSFMLPVPNVPKLSTKTSASATYSVFTIDVETIPDANGLQFGLALTLPQGQKSKSKQKGQAVFSLDLTLVEAKGKIAFQRDQSTEDAFKPPVSLPSECFWKLSDGGCYSKSNTVMDYYAAKKWCEGKKGVLYAPFKFRGTTFKSLDGGTYNYKDQYNVNLRYVRDLIKKHPTVGAMANSKSKVFAIAEKSSDPLGLVAHLYAAIAMDKVRYHGNKTPEVHALESAAKQARDDISDRLTNKTGIPWREYWTDHKSSITGQGKNSMHKMVHEWIDAGVWYELARPSWMGAYSWVPDGFRMVVRGFDNSIASPSHAYQVGDHWKSYRWKDDVSKEGPQDGDWWKMRAWWYVYPKKGDGWQMSHAAIPNSAFESRFLMEPLGRDWAWAGALCYHTGKALKGKPAEDFTFTLTPGIEQSSKLSASVGGGPISITGEVGITWTDQTWPIAFYARRTKDNLYAEIKNTVKLVVEFVVLKGTFYLSGGGLSQHSPEWKIYPVAWLVSALSGVDYSSTDEVYQFTISTVKSVFSCWSHNNQCTKQ